MNLSDLKVAQSTITDEQFVRVRCNTDEKTYYFQAIGSMYAQPLDQDEPAHLFDFFGVDISRCIYDQPTSRWTLVSRKITLYLDPKTGAVLDQWHNPWTGETLNVMHRSYDYQAFPIPPHIPAYVTPEISAVSLDINLQVPNPLAQNPKFAEYSPEPVVQSSDSYKFIFPTRLLDATDLSSTDHQAVALSYYRMGPWEPWMKMKGKPGFLVLNYTGNKLTEFKDLHPGLKDLIQERMPLFQEAPTQPLDRSIATSWSRFEEKFDAYLRGEKFPLPAPMQTETPL